MEEHITALHKEAMLWTFDNEHPQTYIACHTSYFSHNTTLRETGHLSQNSISSPTSCHQKEHTNADKTCFERAWVCITLAMQQKLEGLSKTQETNSHATHPTTQQAMD